MTNVTKIYNYSIIVKNLNAGSRKPTFKQFLTHLAMNSPSTYNRCEAQLAILAISLSCKHYFTPFFCAPFLALLCRHWKPNWLICNPCRFHYDYIVHMETFSRDSGAVLREVSQSPAHLILTPQTSQSHLT